MNPTSDVVARLSSAVKRYGNLTALDGVDLVLHRGELLAVLGPNGAGKSTSISLLLGLIRPDGGRAELFGLDPQQIDARRRIGVMLQSAMLPLTLHVGELLFQGGVLGLELRYIPLQLCDLRLHSIDRGLGRLGIGLDVVELVRRVEQLFACGLGVLLRAGILGV